MWPRHSVSDLVWSTESLPDLIWPRHSLSDLVWPFQSPSVLVWPRHFWSELVWPCQTLFDPEVTSSHLVWPLWPCQSYYDPEVTSSHLVWPCVTFSVLSDLVWPFRSLSDIVWPRHFWYDLGRHCLTLRWPRHFLSDLVRPFQSLSDLVWHVISGLIVCDLVSSYLTLCDLVTSGLTLCYPFSPYLTLCDLLSRCLIFCDLVVSWPCVTSYLTVWSSVIFSAPLWPCGRWCGRLAGLPRSGGPRHCSPSSSAPPWRVRAPAGRPACLHCAVQRFGGGAVSWELNSARGALSARLGGRHPGPHSLLQTTQPQGISLCLLRLGGSGGLPSPARATTLESRRYGTPHAAAHNRLQDSEVARLQCEMDRMKQQHTANILDSMPPWGAQERRCADAAV